MIESVALFSCDQLRAGLFAPPQGSNHCELKSSYEFRFGCGIDFRLLLYDVTGHMEKAAKIECAFFSGLKAICHWLRYSLLWSARHSR